MSEQHTNISDRAPWVFKLLVSLSKRKVPGSFRILDLLNNSGFFKKIIRQTVNREYLLDFPLWHYGEYSYDGHNYLDEQDTAVVETIKNTVKKVKSPVTLLDCGADIGLITVLSFESPSEFEELVVFEPNIESFKILNVNVSRLPVQSSCFQSAVSSYTGYAILTEATHDPSFHARYVEKIEDNRDDAVEVIQIDDLEMVGRAHILMKIDVEGGELQVIQGARKTLVSASEFSIIYEAHPEQISRSGIDPIEILSYLNEIRPIYSVVIGEPTLRLNLNKPYLSQISRFVNRDIFCTTDERVFVDLKNNQLAPFINIH